MQNQFTTKFRDQYRIKSARLPDYDYGQNGAYFITICTKNREHFFGEIIDNQMQLSEIGKIANIYWEQIPNHFPFVSLGEWVVMPNHIHGIVIIDKNMQTQPVETQNFASLQNKNQFGPQSKNLASIIRGFKIGVTKNARTFNLKFSWQPRFYDHVIRNEKDYNAIAEYIIFNPHNWKNDENYM